LVVVAAVAMVIADQLDTQAGQADQVVVALAATLTDKIVSLDLA
jgi:hypothetical protein